MAGVSRFAIATWLALFAILFFTTPAMAEEPEESRPHGASLGGLVGYDMDIEEPMVGADMRFTFPADPSFDLALNPAANYYFVSSGGFIDSATLLQFDFNLLFQFPLEGSITPYVGGGLAMIYLRISGEDPFGGETISETENEIGFNMLVAGIEAQVDPSARIFSQVRLSRFSIDGQSDTTFSLMGGVSFFLG